MWDNNSVEELEQEIKELQFKRRKLSREIDLLDSEIIGYREELRRRRQITPQEID